HRPDPAVLRDRAAGERRILAGGERGHPAGAGGPVRQAAGPADDPGDGRDGGAGLAPAPGTPDRVRAAGLAGVHPHARRRAERRPRLRSPPRHPRTEWTEWTECPRGTSWGGRRRWGGARRPEFWPFWPFCPQSGGE